MQENGSKMRGLRGGTAPTTDALTCLADLSGKHGDMSGETLQRKVTIINPQGFHLRPQSLFAHFAQHFQSEIALLKGDQRVNGKKQWDLMLLAAEPGTELILEITGPDAAQALEILAGILAAASADDLPDPPPPKKG